MGAERIIFKKVTERVRRGRRRGEESDREGENRAERKGYGHEGGVDMKQDCV